MAKARGQRNLYRRLDENGKPYGTWYVDFYHNGRRVRESLNTTVLSEAKDKRDERLGDKDDPKWSKVKRDIVTDDFWKRHQAYSKRHKARNTIAREATNWGQFKGYLKPTTLGSVTRPQVEDFKCYLQDELKQSGRTVNDCISRLRTIYNWAKTENLYSGANPFADIRSLPVEKKPVRFLNTIQIDALLREAQKGSRDLYLFCALCLFAGMRSAEAASARYEWIDWRQKSITIQGDGKGQFRTKSNKYRTVPLSKRLREILKPHKRKDGYVLLPDKTEPGKWRIRYEPKKSFDRARNAAKVKWCTPHTLRHTFASQLVIGGVSLYKVSRWLGHSDLKTTQIYAHLAPHDDDIDVF